ncbi:MAG: TIR domain-containing protein [Blastocatellia bacterium]|nr:TIR domain-containing protein [Blastocatellia bacterium]
MSSTPDRAKLRAAFQRPVKLFISYSHKDEDLREELGKHLSILKHNGVIHEWHDRKIPAGDEWASRIDEQLDQAQIILLLISSDFISSKYCYVIEGQRALERHNRGEAIVIPVILRACDWTEAYFEKLQALPKDARPVKSWPDRDEAFADVARGIRRLIEEMRAPQLDPGAAFAEQVEREQLAEMTVSNPYLLGDRFVGREKELGDLTAWLQRDEGGVYCICDLGGTGKSALVWHWLHREETERVLTERKINRYWCSFYARGFDSHQFLRDLAARLGGLPVGEGGLAEVREFILRRLREEPWLLVLDGLEREMGAFANPEHFQVDSEEQDTRNETKAVLPEEKEIRSHVFAAFLEELRETGAKALITTRLFPENLKASGGRESGVIDYGFRPMSAEDAAQVWELFCAREKNPALQREFFELVGHHPQVISVVAAAVAESHLPMRDWFEGFSEADRQACRDAAAPLTVRRHRWLDLATRDINRNQRAAWLTICYIVRKSEASDIDALMADLVVPDAAEEPPPGRFSAESQLLDVLESLRKRRLIGMDVEQQHVDVHPVIRGHVWKYIVRQYGHGEDKDRELVRHIESSADFKEFLLRYAGEPDLEERVRALDPVAHQLGNLPVAQNLVLGFLGRFFPDSPTGGRPWLDALPELALRKDQARILHRTAHELMEQGLWEESRVVFERAKIAYRLCGDLESVRDCEQSHDWQELYAGSLRAAEKNLLDELERQVGGRSASAPFWLALLLSIRQSDHADPLLRSLKVDENRWTLQTAAECRLYLDQLDEAAALARQALDRREKEPDSVQQLLWERVTLGLALVRLGRADEAVDHLDFANDRGTGWRYNLVPMFALAGLIEYQLAQAIAPGRGGFDRRQQLLIAENVYKRFRNSTLNERAQIPATDAHFAMARVALADGRRDDARRLAEQAVARAEREDAPFHYASGRERAQRFLAEEFGAPIPPRPALDLDALEHEERLQRWMESRKEEKE